MIEQKKMKSKGKTKTTVINEWIHALRKESGHFRSRKKLLIINSWGRNGFMLALGPNIQHIRYTKYECDCMCVRVGETIPKSPKSHIATKIMTKQHRSRKRKKKWKPSEIPTTNRVSLANSIISFRMQNSRENHIDQTELYFAFVRVSVVFSCHFKISDFKAYFSHSKHKIHLFSGRMVRLVK